MAVPARSPGGRPVAAEAPAGGEENPRDEPCAPRRSGGTGLGTRRMAFDEVLTSNARWTDVRIGFAARPE